VSDKAEKKQSARGRIEELPAASRPNVSSGQEAVEPTNKYKVECDRAAAISKARKESYLAKDVADLLIQQIGLELNNQYLYHNFGIWCDINSLFGQAEYFYHRAGEEHDHAQWIIDYLTQADYLFSIPGTDARYIDIYRNKDKLTPKLAHEEVLIREIETTRSINNIKATADETRDYITSHWLRQLLLEQAEEEELSHTALDIFDHTEDPLIVDKYFKDVVMAQLKAGGE
jgi:ferritin